MQQQQEKTKKKKILLDNYTTGNAVKSQKGKNNSIDI